MIQEKGKVSPPRRAIRVVGVAQLSPRQAACLGLAAEGKTSQEIGNTLGISWRTVDKYVAGACERLGVRNRIHAVTKALQLGLLSLGPR